MCCWDFLVPKPELGSGGWIQFRRHGGSVSNCCQLAVPRGDAGAHVPPRGDVLVQRGYRVTIAADGTKTHSRLKNAITKEEIRVGDWNEIRVVAEGDKLTFTINGKIASEVIDREQAKRVDRGYLGLQLHQGDSMRVEFRNLRVKTFEAHE